MKGLESGHRPVSHGSPPTRRFQTFALTLSQAFALSDESPQANCCPQTEHPPRTSALAHRSVLAAAHSGADRWKCAGLRHRRSSL
eukprot:3941687-Rhodomonas_salina.2